MVRYAIFHNKNYADKYPDDFIRFYNNAVKFSNNLGYVTPAVLIAKYNIDDFIENNQRLHEAFDVAIFIGDINSDPICRYVYKVCQNFQKGVIKIDTSVTPIEKLTKAFLASYGEKKLITLCSMYGVDYHTVEEQMAEYLFSLVKK